MPADARAQLIRQLQGAYSGELAAGHAYRGHWHSLRVARVRDRVRTIESEEWHHRNLVRGLLEQLGAKPKMRREIIFWCIGKAIGLFCHVGGWFAPIYGAGKLERHNIVEYEDAAVFAAQCGRHDMIDCLLTMAEVEWEHELFFRELIAEHWLTGVFPMWEPAPPKETIRAKHAPAANQTSARLVQRA